MDRYAETQVLVMALFLICAVLGYVLAILTNNYILPLAQM